MTRRFVAEVAAELGGDTQRSCAGIHRGAGSPE